MNKVEAIGDAATDDPSAACLNCGTPLSGPYCALCGQKARVPRSLRTFFHDMIQGLFNFEGKIWRTLPMLAWKPGEMTRRYIVGERARFVSPVALYLFSVFLMFAVLNSTGSVGADPRPYFDGVVIETRADLAALSRERAAAVARGADVARVDRRITSKRTELARLEQVQRGGPLQVEGMDDNDAPAWVREALARVQRDPQAFILKVQDAASKFSWLLIPLSVPFLWMLFPFNRRYRLYDHTVFVTYSLSFMMILVVIGGLLVAAGLPSLGSMLIFVPPIHMYRQLKGAYQLSRLSALLRTTVLVTFALVAAVLFTVAVLGIGLFD